jgi:DNA polymerase III epsilon subunit-like protein
MIIAPLLLGAALLATDPFMVQREIVQPQVTYLVLVKNDMKEIFSITPDGNVKIHGKSLEKLNNAETPASPAQSITPSASMATGLTRPA